MSRKTLGKLTPTLAAAVMAVSTPSLAQVSGYYNYPDISGDQIVFSSENDLWLISASGGEATRLTSDPGTESHPRFSPDGTKIAYSGTYDGNTDVYVISTAGGAPVRLTYHLFSDQPTGWSPDGEFVFHQSARNHPNFNRRVFKVPVSGGVPEEVPIGSASYFTMADDGETVAFNRNYVQTRTWKRYGGGLADDIWVGNLAEDNFFQLTEYFGNDLTPMFVGDRVYFCSERDGRMNLWSTNRDGDDLRQHTEFDDFDVRWPETDGETRIVFQHGADIWLYDTETEDAEVVDIELRSDRVWTRTQFPKAEDYLESAYVSDDGKKTLLTIRGDVFNAPVDLGLEIPVTASPGSREMHAVFGGDEEQYAVYFSDKSGEYELYKSDARSGANEEMITKPGDERRGNHPVSEIFVANNGENVAWSDQTGTLYWTNLTTKTLTIVDSSDTWELNEAEWSPDGRWLAYSKYLQTEYQQIYIHDTQTGENHAVTDEFFDSSSPSWDPAGDYLFFESDRTFDRMGGAFEYEVIMTDPTKLYALPLRKDVKSPFWEEDPYEADDEKKAKEEEEGSDEEEAESEEEDAKDIEIDFDGIADRVVPFPMENGTYGGISAVADMIFYFSNDGSQWDLMTWKYKDRDAEPKTFAENVNSYRLSRDRSHIVYMSGDKVSVMATTEEEASDKAKGPKLSEITLLLDPVAEWRQILAETYRFNRDFFYMADMAGVDWKGRYESYSELFDRVGIRAELNDIISNLIAELGHGHTYLWGAGDNPNKGRSVSTGSLGADFAVKDDQVVLSRIRRGESWDPDLRSPLNNHQTREIQEGWALLAVNGKEVTTDVDPYSYFWGLANKEVLIRVSSDGSDENAKNYRVKLLSDDSALRYRQWVKDNRAYVSEKSNGEIGYIHLPDMSTPGLIAFFRDFYPQIQKKALVVDVRWNGGGNVSQLLTRRLSEKLYNLGMTQNFEALSTYPSRVFIGPMACIINESAGSDGDIFPRTFSKMELGPLIGTRTWGGVVGIRGGTRFVDNGSVSIPEFGHYDMETGYTIENYGIDPDIEVAFTPSEEAAGEDPQLDRTIEYLLEEMKDPKYKRPELPKTGPNRSTESFRERSKDWMDKP